MSEAERSKRISGLAGVLTGLIVVLALSAQGVIGDVHLPNPVGIGVNAVIFGALFGVAIYRRDPLVGAAGFVLLPGAVGNLAFHFYDDPPLWAGALRALGLVLVLCAVVGALLYLARGLEELERLLFTEATSVVFFLTLVAAGAYAALEAFLDAPKVSLGWLPLVGLALWGLTSALFSRRYT